MAKSKPKTTYTIHRQRTAKPAATAPPALSPTANGAHPDISIEKDLWEAAVQLRGHKIGRAHV
jgi:hypothetical protein